MYYIGIDTGAITTDGVLIDGDCRVVAELVRKTDPDMSRASNAVRDELLRTGGIGLSSIAATVSTGYGRETASFATHSTTEIICHARGARHLFPKSGLVIDIGGQDTKVIALDAEGYPEDFVMNDKCAAGTGRFLEVMAAALHVPLEEMGRRSLKSKNAVSLASTCTVFGETEVISLLSKGVAVTDILAALHRAVAERVVGMMSSLRGLRLNGRGSAVITGGVARNEGVVRTLEEKLGVKILLPANPQTVGALGAALIARTGSSRAEQERGR